MAKSTIKVTSHALLVTALTLTTLMLIQSSTRRPNFDEWLVLRSGWLMASHEPSNLHFLMPWTWLAGQLSKLVHSAPVLIASLRLVTAAAVLTTLWWALREQHQSRDRALQAYVLTLSCGAFIGYSVEFRYDAVVLWSLLAAWGLLAHPTPRKMTVLGALIAVLALHQTKGLFFAITLIVSTLVVARNSTLAVGRSLLMGALIPGALWCWVLIDQGLLIEQLAVYKQFARLRTELGAPTWTNLLAQLHNDAGWWLLMTAAAVLTMSRAHQSRATNTTLMLGLAPLMFILLHPRPWPYMLAPCAPLLASLCTSGLNSFGRKAAAQSLDFHILSAGCIVLAAFSMPNHIHALQASGRGDLQTLELLRAVQTHRDRVLDPSGSVYFIIPIAPDWYLDGLFRHRMTQGAWHPAPSDSAQLPSIVVRSYRLDWITAFPADLIHRNYEQACHWIWLRRGDPRTQIMREKCPIKGEDTLLNYWQITP